MLFGKKNKKNRDKLSVESHDSQFSDGKDEIELACRDLVLAGLESMRKDVVVRDHDKNKAKPSEPADIAKESATEAERPESYIEIEEKVDIHIEDTIELHIESDGCPLESYNHAVPIEQQDCLGVDKQKIIDMIVAEDIKRALRSV